MGAILPAGWATKQAQDREKELYRRPLDRSSGSDLVLIQRIVAWCQTGRVIDCVDADLHGGVARTEVAYRVNLVGDRTAGHQAFEVSTFVTICERASSVRCTGHLSAISSIFSVTAGPGSVSKVIRRSN